MKKTKINIILILLGIVICYAMFVKIYTDGCYCVKGIETKYLVNGISCEDNITYCKLLRGSLKGDETDIKEFALMNFEGAYSYYHGGVILDVIDRIEEEKFISAISMCSLEEQKRIEAYLCVGIVYYSDCPSNITCDEYFEKHYPKVWKFFNKYTTLER